MNCAAKSCVYCSPTREQWKIHWDNPDFSDEYFSHRGTSVSRIDIPSLAGDGIAGGTNDVQSPEDFRKSLIAKGFISK